jgi:hypothetical protein
VTVRKPKVSYINLNLSWEKRNENCYAKLPECLHSGNHVWPLGCRAQPSARTSSSRRSPSALDDWTRPTYNEPFSDVHQNPGSNPVRPAVDYPMNPADPTYGFTPTPHPRLLRPTTQRVHGRRRDLRPVPRREEHPWELCPHAKFRVDVDNGKYRFVGPQDRRRLELEPLDDHPRERRRHWNRSHPLQ